ncbi:response regulator [Streptomyces sp. NPDC127098]|uniref:response regulator n=1 Tax=Streptomyces sp. NPDC127098 TaxID=3347137 RepID=UPI00365E980E
MRVVIAEDDALLREGLTLILAGEGLDVVAAVDTAEAFLVAVAEHRPDATVVDVRLPPGFSDEGLRAALEVRRRHPGLPVLVLSSYVEDRYAAELLADGAGATGYLLKQRVGEVTEFTEALRRVAAGGTAMDPEVVAQLLTRRRADDPLRTLTDRERQVLALMAEGRANAEIAELLVVSEGAVNKHVRSVFAKLHLAPGDSGHRRVLAVLAYLNR